jgi:bifunctional ADP-heptose synthase (sugar kinase/adenylyltransferase)
MFLEGLIITLSEHGILYCDTEKYIHSKGFPISVSDVSGAGDTVSAILSLSVAANLPINLTLDLCNIAGSIACSNFGAISVSIEEVIERSKISGI